MTKLLDVEDKGINHLDVDELGVMIGTNHLDLMRWCIINV